MNFDLRDIVVAISRKNDITAIYREDRSDLSLIYRFDTLQFLRYFADLSAINHENKARYSAIIACITFAQYCSDISDHDLDHLVRNVQQQHPGVGITLLKGHLKSLGHHIQRDRIQLSLLRTDPTGVLQKWKQSVKR